MRLVDADELERLFYAQVEAGATDLMDAFDDALQDAQAVDAVPVVRCKDCKWCEFWDSCKEYKCWNIRIITVEPDGYCSFGERREK